MFLWRGVANVDAAMKKLDAELAVIEERAEQESISQKATLYKRAGDLCAEHKSRDKLTVSYYGKSIDCYVKCSMFEAAAVLCRKLVKFSPTVVRAHFTLAALALLDQRVGDATSEVTSYVHAAKRTRTERLAIPRLRFLADVSDEPQLRTALVEGMLFLGDRDGAANAQRGRATIPHAIRSSKLVELITLDPHELWERAWIESEVPADGRPTLLSDFALRDDLPPATPTERRPRDR
jgi:hypothetical protein